MPGVIAASHAVGKKIINNHDEIAVSSWLSFAIQPLNMRVPCAVTAARSRQVRQLHPSIAAGQYRGH